jgi:hypothetical protein
MESELYSLVDLHKQINTLMKLRYDLDLKKYKQTFEQFSELLKNSVYRVSITNRKSKCIYCKTRSMTNPIILPCYHIICSINCLENTKKNHSDNLNNIKCKCGVLIPQELLTQIKNFSV